MKSLFTIHAGEYLVGSYIENNLKKKIKGKTQKTFNVWLPAKDTGIDLLVSNYDNSKTVSLQVKFSKDFISNEWNEILRLGLKSCGWWTLNRNKIKNSNANYWIFVLYNVYSKEEQFVIIKPKTLLQLFNRLKRKGTVIQSYIWVTSKNRCWETRGLNTRKQFLLATHSFTSRDRDLTPYLNNWKPIEKYLIKH